MKSIIRDEENKGLKDIMTIALAINYNDCLIFPKGIHWIFLYFLLWKILFFFQMALKKIIRYQIFFQSYKIKKKMLNKNFIKKLIKIKRNKN